MLEDDEADENVPVSSRDSRRALRTELFEDANAHMLCHRKDFYRRRRNKFPGRSKDPTPNMRLPIYPYSKGLSLVNDGVAYGEEVSELRLSAQPTEGKAVDEYSRRQLKSLRTRTGKLPEADDEDTATPGETVARHDSSTPVSVNEDKP